MPYKSEKQRRYMHLASDMGEIPKKVVDEFDKKSKNKKLPEKVGAKRLEIKK